MELNIVDAINVIIENKQTFSALFGSFCFIVVSVASIIAQVTHNEVDPKTLYGKFVLFCDRFAVRKEITTVKKK